jgi:hypothetical protein
MSWAKGLGAALAGTLTGLAESAEAEDKKREEITKLGLAQRLKNIEDAKKLQKASEKKRQEQDSFVSTFAGKFGFMNEETQKIEPLSEAQALEIYTMTSGDPAKALELITDPKKQISFKGVGKVEEIKPVSELAGFDQTLEAFQQMKPAGGLFGRGRYEAVARELENQTKTLGLPSEIEVPQLRKAIGTGLSIESGDKVKIRVNGQVEWTSPAGIQMIREGGWTDDGRLLIRNAEGELEAAPGNASFRTYAQRTQDVPPPDVIYSNVDKQLNSKPFQNKQEKYETSQVGLQVLGSTLNNMANNGALREEVYSGFTKLVGNISSKVGVEIAGITFTLIGGNSSTLTDSDLEQIDKFVQKNRNSTEAAIQAEVLAALQVRAGYAFIQAEGEVRPTDADLLRGINQFKASNPEEFVKKALANWTDSQNKLTILKQAYLGDSAFKQAKDFANMAELENAQYYQMWINNNTPTDSSIVDPPAILERDPDDPTKFIINTDIAPQPKPAQGKVPRKEVSVKLIGVTGGEDAVVRYGERGLEDAVVIVPGYSNSISYREAVRMGIIDESSIK